MTSDKVVEKIGLLSGSGELPVIFAEKIKDRFQLITSGVINITSYKLEKISTNFKWFTIGNIDKCLDFFYREGVFKIVVLGKFDKTIVFKNSFMSNSLKKILKKLKDGRDLSFFKILCNEAKKRGLKIVEPSLYIPDLLVKEDQLTKTSPTIKQLQDIKFGWKIAKKISGLDIGQTVVIKNLTVLAIEAIEGTDETILRGGNLSGGGAVVVKVARPNQDMRFDIPVVGPRTLISMAKVNSKALALEKGKVFIVNKSKVIEIAEKNGISIIGIGGYNGLGERGKSR